MNETYTRAEWFSDFIDYRKAYGYKTGSYNFIVCFLNWCARTYPNDPYLRQEMLDAWRSKRPTENDESHGNRAAYLNKFLVFINEHGGGPFSLHTFRTAVHRVEPVPITREQIRNFFKAVDELPAGRGKDIAPRLTESYVRAVELPVFFRLQYSSGARPNELRWLNREDVDLENGIIHIHRTKGYIERIIALHPSVTRLLRQYDALIREVMPNAKPFFPNVRGGYQSSYWLRINFRPLWYKYNPKPEDGGREVVSYAFRHNYAIENIMNWHQDGYNADKRLVALSRSMGHVHIKSTQYYFHLVPRFADLLEDMEGESVDRMIREVEL